MRYVLDIQVYSKAFIVRKSSIVPLERVESKNEMIVFNDCRNKIMVIEVKEHSDFYANRPYFLRWISAIFFRSKIICRGDSPLNRVKIPRMFPLPPSRAAQTIWANRTKMTVRINLKFIADSIFFLI